MKKLKFLTLAIFAVIAINCCKGDDDTKIDTNDTNNKDRTFSDTINFKEINTKYLLNCMLINDVEMKKDSFVIRSSNELVNNFIRNTCNDYLPEINFQDSIIIGYKTMIGGSGHKNQLSFGYNSSTNIYTFSITAFENDTALLRIDLNWIIIAKIEIDSLNYELNLIRE